MRIIKRTAVLIASLAATFAWSTPAYATTYTVPASNGIDYATWNSDTNVLKICDHTQGNGTATAFLTLGGRTWQKSDGDGASGNCASLGPLSGVDGDTGTLKACTTASSGCGPLMGVRG